jgi:hypothetical protein
MMQASTTESTLPGDTVARAVGAVALGALALIHVEDLPDTISSSLLIGVEYLGLIAASIVVAGLLLIRSGPRVWLAAAALAGSAMLAYTLSRTTGIPGDSGDIGNWRCSLGLAALTVEAMILLVTGSAVLTGFRVTGPDRRVATTAGSADPRPSITSLAIRSTTREQPVAEAGQ